jgi:biopolymer transport protein ExbB/TolQ
MSNIELLLHEISKYFLTPVLIVLVLMFAVALFYTGMLLVELLQRWRGLKNGELTRVADANPGINQERLELHLLKTIEPLRIISRVAPMLGLVATMIPMGPALLAVSSGDMQSVAQNLVVAFSAVIIALLAAALTFTVLSLRRRWLLEELTEILDVRHGAPQPVHMDGVAHG